MPRCPHCMGRVDELDLLDDDEEEDDETDIGDGPAKRKRTRVKTDAHIAREWELCHDGRGGLLTTEEAVRRALGHRLELEFDPIPRIRVYGRTIAATSPEDPGQELWEEAFELIVDLGSAPNGVSLQ